MSSPTAGQEVDVRLPGDIDSINHVGLAVADIEATAALWERLGFTLTPLSMHVGAPGPGAPSEPLGTGNRCAIFESNYVELLAYVDESLPDLGVRDSLARFEGAHFTCLGCGDAAVVDERLTEAGVPTSGVMPLQREIETEAGLRTARFERVFFDDGSASEGEVQAAHHFTPEHIHQPRYVKHDNGARGISELVVVTDDPEARAKRYALFSAQSAHREGKVWMIPLPAGRITVCSPGDLEEATGVADAPPAPAIAAVRITTGSLADARSLWAERGIPTTDRSDQSVIQREHASGVALIFEEG